MNLVSQLWSPGMLGEMFRFGLPFAEKVLRPILVYGFLVIALRIFGKRELAQLNPANIFDIGFLPSVEAVSDKMIVLADKGFKRRTEQPEKPEDLCARSVERPQADRNCFLVVVASLPT